MAIYDQWVWSLGEAVFRGRLVFPSYDTMTVAIEFEPSTALSGLADACEEAAIVRFGETVDVVVYRCCIGCLHGGSTNPILRLIEVSMAHVSDSSKIYGGPVLG